MVLTQMYCAEQIIIPELLTNSLKIFAKAAIKTQPYDLLRWSAAYYRCLAINVPPPVKSRYEKNLNYGTLTKGYIRVLIEQIGKGYFVKRELLQNRWEGLCLPEEELLQILSLGRMLNWEQIHWLKIISLMVGSMNDNFHSTMCMLCDLLTTEPEGGSSPVPMWMFKECYKYLAQLDCSREQTFINGRKLLLTGTLENENVQIQLPKVLSTTSFRKIILDELKEKLGRTTRTRYKRDLAASDISSISEREDENQPITRCMRDTSDDDESNISESYKFVGNFDDPYEVCKRAPDFDSVIVLLKNIRDGENLRHFNGPFHVSEREMKKQKKQQEEIDAKREQISQTLEQTARLCVDEKHIELLKEIGPPWSWLNQFASQNCRSKSFNFVEQVSICSDETPCASCDGSFDFDAEDFKKPTLTMSVSSVESSEESCMLRPKSELEALGEGVGEEEEEKEMLSHMDMMMMDQESVKSADEVIQTVIDELMEQIEEAIKLGECDLTNNQSLMKIIDGSKPPAKKCINYKQLRTFLEQAEEAGMKFGDLSELYKFFTSHSGKLPDKVVYDEYDRSLMENVANIEDDVRNLECIKAMEPDGTELSNDFKPNETDMVEIFADCGIEIDQKVLQSTAPPGDMILGLMEGNCEEEQEPEQEPEPVVEPEEVTESKEELIHNENTQTEPYCKRSQEMKRCGARDKGETPPSEEERKEPYICKIPVMRGIGPPVKERTVDCFIEFLRQCSLNQKGMIYPRNFYEKICPNMID